MLLFVRRIRMNNQTLLPMERIQSHSTYIECRRVGIACVTWERGEAIIDAGRQFSGIRCMILRLGYTVTQHVRRGFGKRMQLRVLQEAIFYPHPHWVPTTSYASFGRNQFNREQDTSSHSPYSHMLLSRHWRWVVSLKKEYATAS